MRPFLFALLLTTLASAELPPIKPYTGPKLDMEGAVESPAFDSDKFIIACWVPSFYDLETWARRGINIAWFNQGLNPREKTLQEYSNKAWRLGIQMWRYPAAHMQPPIDPKFDGMDKSLHAYSLIDEPVLHKMDDEDIAEQAKVFRAANPKMKLVLNLEGDKFTMPNPSKEVIERHAGYMAAADIGFVDWYVKNRNAERYPLSHLWTTVERLVVWGKGKPVGAFIECSNQKISELGREPTPGEMRAQILGSIIYGARLIAYFPEVPGKKNNKGTYFGTGNDGTPPQLEKEMMQINRQLQQLAPILHAPGAHLKNLQPKDIPAAVRWYKGTQYLIVLNDDDEETIDFSGEKLGPFEWRIYNAGPAPKK